MKYLSSYLEEKQTQLFDEFGVFFAFGQDQLKEGIAKNKHHLKDGDKFVSVGGIGMIMPRNNIEQFTKKHASLVKDAIKQDLAENGRAGVLERELGNYEIGLSYDGYNDPNFRDGIKGYGFTEDEIKAAYKHHMAVTEY